MKDFFKKIQHMHPAHLREVGMLTASVAVLLVVAGYISTGGVERIGTEVALHGVSPSSLIAGPFPCSWTGDCNNTVTQEYYSLTADKTTVAPGQQVQLVYISGIWQSTGTSIGYCPAPGDPDNNIYASYRVRHGGQSPTCSLTGFGTVYTNNATRGGTVFVYPTVTTTYVFHSDIGASEGYPDQVVTVTVSNPPATCSISASPSAINQAQTTSISYSTANATSVTWSYDGANQGAPSGNPFTINGANMTQDTHTIAMQVSGPGGTGTCSTKVTVTAVPAPSCTLTTLVTNNYASPYSYATFAYTTANAVSATYKVDGGSAQTPGNNPFNIANLSPGYHSVIMTVTNSSGATATCGSANNLYTGAAPVPTASLLAGGSHAATVNANGTTTLVWSSQYINPRGASVTAASNSSTVTNFASMTHGGGTYYFETPFVANGYAYQLGGYDGSTWAHTLFRTPVGSNIIGGGVWTNLGNLSSSIGAAIPRPLVLNGNVYLYGGYSNVNGYISTICTTSVAGLNTVGSWTCPTTLPSGSDVSQDFADPVIIGDYIYMFGGYNGTSGVGSLRSVLRAPVSNPTSFINFPNVLPQPMYSHATAIVGNYVYLFGGYNSQTGTPLNTVYRALLTSDLTLASSWSSGGTIPAATHLPGVAVDANYLYLFGGYLTGGTPSAAIYKIVLATLAAGNISPGSWTSAGTLSTAMYPAIPFIIENTLYMSGGYNGSAYNNPFIAVPFNAGTPYTNPSILPWHTDGGTNAASTWPLTVSSVTYNLNASNPAGSAADSATVSLQDLCTNAPFTGIQNPIPSGVTATGSTCSCTTSGTAWDGSACVVPQPPTITVTPSLNGGVSAIQRVRKGSAVKLYWSVTGLIDGDTSTTCTIRSSPASALVPQSWDNTGTAWTQGTSVPSITISNTTVFTLTCSNTNYGTVSKSATVGTIPTYIEE